MCVGSSLFSSLGRSLAHLVVSVSWWLFCPMGTDRSSNWYYVVALQHYLVCRANACGKLRAWQKKMEVALLRHSNVIIPSNPARADIRKTMYITKHVYTYLLVWTCADTCTKTIEAELGETDCSVTEYVLFEQLHWTYSVKSFFEWHSWNTVPEQQEHVCLRVLDSACAARTLAFACSRQCLCSRNTCFCVFLTVLVQQEQVLLRVLESACAARTRVFACFWQCLCSKNMCLCVLLCSVCEHEAPKLPSPKPSQDPNGNIDIYRERERDTCVISPWGAIPAPTCMHRWYVHVWKTSIAI